MSNKKNITYEAASQELQDIIQQLQDEAVPIDELSAKTRRAAELIRLCRQKLRDTEVELGGLFDDGED